MTRVLIPMSVEPKVDAVYPVPVRTLMSKSVLAFSRWFEGEWMVFNERPDVAATELWRSSGAYSGRVLGWYDEPQFVTAAPKPAEPDPIDPNAGMIQRDGPSRPKPVPPPVIEHPTAKPPCRGLLLSWRGRFDA